MCVAVCTWGLMDTWLTPSRTAQVIFVVCARTNCEVVTQQQSRALCVCVCSYPDTDDQYGPAECDPEAAQPGEAPNGSSYDPTSAATYAAYYGYYGAVQSGYNPNSYWASYQPGYWEQGAGEQGWAAAGHQQQGEGVEPGSEEGKPLGLEMLAGYGSSDGGSSEEEGDRACQGEGQGGLQGGGGQHGAPEEAAAELGQHGPQGQQGGGAQRSPASGGGDRSKPDGCPVPSDG